ncbi:SDR family oxidoreductase [Sphingomonas sp. CL5.1]|uniref:SDR family oxidoreductase n=1 Tax=Sphingomonas sp. CL5.1 TaxID=2653203 RepID=UPI001C2EA621|nr:SDR family NAD(P)-dependent oxidoreductase [Sphingomonas sp. CL5.1]
MSGNSILVTGGGSGIGLGLAQALHARGNRVVICGRDRLRLEAAARGTPGLVPLYADISTVAGRDALLADTLAIAPDLNVLINNAGIQRRVEFSADLASWAERAREIAVNLEAPIHLAALFLPLLRERRAATIVNVSSGLAFLPVTFAPVYAATKAGLHSFTMTLRADLSGSSVSVIEVIPPMVDTGLGGAGIHASGVSVDIFVEAVMERIAAGETEIGYGLSDILRNADRQELTIILTKIQN